jgi:hypothetical protein
MGRNDLETTEDWYIMSGGEAGGSGLPPDLQCPLLADGDIIGQADCGQELGKPSPGPVEPSQSSVPRHRAKLGRSQRSGRSRPTCPPRPDAHPRSLHGSPRNAAEAGVAHPIVRDGWTCQLS